MVSIGFVNKKQRINKWKNKQQPWVFSWEFSENFRTAMFFKIPVFILETCVFSPFISIYHSNSQDFCQVCVYRNAFSLPHLRTGNNIWAAISNSQTDWPTAWNLKLGRVAAHNLQIARLTTHTPEIIEFAIRRLAACRFTTCRFAILNYSF